MSEESQYTATWFIHVKVHELELRIDRLSYEQSGTYTCEAKDSSGKFKQATITLTLERKCV